MRRTYYIYENGCRRLESIVKRLRRQCCSFVAARAEDYVMCATGRRRSHAICYRGEDYIRTEARVLRRIPRATRPTNPWKMRAWETWPTSSSCVKRFTIRLVAVFCPILNRTRCPFHQLKSDRPIRDPKAYSFSCLLLFFTTFNSFFFFEKSPYNLYLKRIPWYYVRRYILKEI